MGDVVAVADIREPQPVQLSEALLQGEQVGEHLTRMVGGRQPVDDRHGCAVRELAHPMHGSLGGPRFRADSRRGSGRCRTSTRRGSAGAHQVGHDRGGAELRDTDLEGAGASGSGAKAMTLVLQHLLYDKNRRPTTAWRRRKDDGRRRRDGAAARTGDGGRAAASARRGDSTSTMASSASSTTPSD